MIKHEGERTKTLDESRIALVAEANNRLLKLGRPIKIYKTCQAYEEVKLLDGSFVRIPAVTFALAFKSLEQLDEAVDHMFAGIAKRFDITTKNTILWLRAPITLEVEPSNGYYTIRTRLAITSDIAQELADDHMSKPEPTA